MRINNLFICDICATTFMIQKCGKECPADFDMDDGMPVYPKCDNNETGDICPDFVDFECPNCGWAECDVPAKDDPPPWWWLPESREFTD